MTQMRPVMLVILDGWGLRAEAADNAILQAHVPTYAALTAACPTATLVTSGRDVGLPDGQMGNSEVGHLNIGAGRVVMQDLPRITAAIESGEIARNRALATLVAGLRKTGGVCHLAGLVSTGGVHSHQDHAVAIARVLAAADVPVLVHVFTDGRDTAPQSGAAFVADLVRALPATARIASVSGRYYAMDRDTRWERIERAYMAVAEGRGAWFADAGTAIAAGYAAGLGDEFLEPAVIGDYAGMRDGDGLVCFNFRADRVREILGALLDPAFKGFQRPRAIRLTHAVGLTRYSDDLAPLMATMFEPQSLANGIGEVVSKAGRTQVRMAETEKYAHVTYFLNGGVETPYAGEDRILVPSPKVATYDLKPEMSAPELTDKAVEAIRSGRYDLLVLNYANPDMVGHTGNLAAAVRAVEAVDAGLGRLVEAMRSMGGSMLVIADHGNCELMRDPQTGGPHTAHTTNPVPVILVGAAGRNLADGRLADVAPTLLALMGLEPPPEMAGRPLLR